MKLATAPLFATAVHVPQIVFRSRLSFDREQVRADGGRIRRIRENTGNSAY